MSLTTTLRRTVYAVLARWDGWTHQPLPMVSILCYHSFANDGWYFSTPPQDLSQQLDLLAQHFTFLTLQDLENYLAGRKKITQPSLIFTIDDGYQNILDAVPTWQQFNILPTVFLLAQPSAANRSELDNQLPFLTTRQIATLAKAGWTFGSHTATHPNLATLTQDQLETEIQTAQRLTSEQLGQPCRWIAYPRGKYTPQVLELAAQAGFTLGLTMDDAQISLQTSPLAIPRVGVNHTHTPNEILDMLSPSCVQFRKCLKKIISFAI